MKRSFQTRARLWLYINNDFVKVTLKPGQTINWYESHPTEEGYHFTQIAVEYDGEDVYLTEVDGGRDCDGQLEHTYKMGCSLANLRADPIDIKMETIPRPKWEHEPTRVYDQYAQLANY